MIDFYKGKYIGKDYEVQWYNKKGDYESVTHCTTSNELLQVLARYCWGDIKPYNNPAIYYNGEPWCRYEYSKVM